MWFSLGQQCFCLSILISKTVRWRAFFGNIDSGSVLNSLSKNGKVMLICTRASPGCLILTNFFAVLHVYWYCSCLLYTVLLTLPSECKPKLCTHFKDAINAKALLSLPASLWGSTSCGNT